MQKSVIVYGPPRSGKSRNAQALAHHFGLSTTVDLEHAPLARSFAPTGTLYLCQEPPAWATAADRRILPITEAMRQAGIA